MDRLYADHPEVYDAIQADWDYDRDISFVVEALDTRGCPTPEDCQLLEVGCGTGEHTRRFADRGFDVTAVDRSAGMLDRAREKCDREHVRFREMALPALPAGEYDAVVALRGVVNHLPPAELAPALAALADRLADGGVLVFDNSPLPPDGTGVGLDVGRFDGGEYARLAQHVPTGDGRLDWRSVVLLPDGEWFVDSREMTPFADRTLRRALSELGLAVDTHEGFGPGDDRTVFVAVD